MNQINNYNKIYYLTDFVINQLIMVIHSLQDFDHFIILESNLSNLAIFVNIEYALHLAIYKLPFEIRTIRHIENSMTVILVVIELALKQSNRRLQCSISLHFAIYKLTLIYTTIWPLHDSFTFDQIVAVLSGIELAIRPLHSTIAFSFVISELSRIYSSIRIFHDPSSIRMVITELS